MQHRIDQCGITMDYYVWIKPKSICEYLGCLGSAKRSAKAISKQLCLTVTQTALIHHSLGGRNKKGSWSSLDSPKNRWSTRLRNLPYSHNGASLLNKIIVNSNRRWAYHNIPHLKKHNMKPCINSLGALHMSVQNSSHPVLRQAVATWLETTLI